MSSFGFGGTNAHVVLSAAPDGAGAPRSAEGAPASPALVSARTPGALGRLAGATAEAPPHGRRPGRRGRLGPRPTGPGSPWRLGAWDDPAGPALDAAAAALARTSGDEDPIEGPGWVAGRSPAAPSVAWLFSGQGAQYAGMGAELFAADPAFRTRVTALAAGFEAERAAHPAAYSLEGGEGWPLLAVLYPGLQGRTFPDGVAVPDAGLTPERAPAVLAETAYTQPALFVTGVALAERWAAAGVVPSVVVGHSVGELAAAVATGRLGLADGLALACARGRAMQAGPAGGAMAAVYAGADAAAEAIAEAGAEAVSVASDNGPSRSVVSGPSEAVAEVEAALAARGVRTRRLAVSHAFHSDATTTAAEALAGGVAVSTAVTTAVAGGPEWSAPAPRARVVSAVTGAEADGSWATPAYWSEQVLAPVRYGPALAAVVEGGATVLVEVGPGSTLVGLGRLAAEEGGLGEPAGGLTWVRGLREGAEAVSWGEGVCRAHVAGVEVAAAGVWPGAGRAPWAAATYPFEPERHWPVSLEAGSLNTRGNDSESQRTVRARPRAYGVLGDALDLGGTHITFETALSLESAPLFAGHRVGGRPVLPASAYVEMGLRAGLYALSETAVTVEGLVLHSALTLGESPRIVRTEVTIESEGLAHFEVTSRGDGSSWETHSSGRVRRFAAVSDPPAFDDLAVGLEDGPSVEAYYDGLSARGLDYDGAFRGIVALQTGPSRVLARLQAAGDSTYVWHPAILDSAFQSVGALVPSDNAPLIPASVEAVHVRCPLGHVAYASVSIRGGETDHGLDVDLELYTETGEHAGSVLGLHLKRLAPGAIMVRSTDKLPPTYKIEWQRHDLSTALPPSPTSVAILGGPESLQGPFAARFAGARRRRPNGRRRERRSGGVARSNFVPPAARRMVRRSRCRDAAGRRRRFKRRRARHARRAQLAPRHSDPSGSTGTDPHCHPRRTAWSARRRRDRAIGPGSDALVGSPAVLRSRDRRGRLLRD